MSLSKNITSKTGLSLQDLTPYLPFKPIMFANLIIKSHGKPDQISDEYITGEIRGITEQVLGHNPPEWTGKYKIQLKDGDTQWHAEYLDEYKIALHPMSKLLSDDMKEVREEINNSKLWFHSDQPMHMEDVIEDGWYDTAYEFLPTGIINILLKNHLDIYCLMEQGKAVDINTLNLES